MSTVLVHIGYHKTGTTWLQKRFFGDPATGYGFLGEETDHPARRLYRDRPLEFDAVDVRRSFDRLLEETERKGLLPVVSLERLSGAPDSGGYDVKLIADRLREVLPEARILVVVREQRSMIISAYKMYVRAGGVCALPHFLDPPTDRTARVPSFDLRYFEYDHLIRYYRSLYGDGNVLALAYEQLVEDQRGFVARIAEFAGRPVPDALLDRLAQKGRAHASASALTIGALRHMNRFRQRTELNPAPLFEARSTAPLMTRLARRDALVGPGTRRLAARSEGRLRQAVDEAVGDRYIESNRRTAELLGVDLGAYGWRV